MHPQALVKRLAEAQDRILVASDELANQGGVESPRTTWQAIKAPSQEIMRMFQLEVIADFLESLNTQSPAQAQEEPKRPLSAVEVRPPAYVATAAQKPPAQLEATKKANNDQKRHS